MKLKYEIEKMYRIKSSYFIGITTFDQPNVWYNLDMKEWQKNPDMGKYYFSSHQPCHSVRAFRRKLKRCPKGMTFILVSRIKGRNTTGKGSGEPLKVINEY